MLVLGFYAYSFLWASYTEAVLLYNLATNMNCLDAFIFDYQLLGDEYVTANVSMSARHEYLYQSLAEFNTCSEAIDWRFW